MTSPDAIPLSLPYLSDRERRYLGEVLESRHFSGLGRFGARCEAVIARRLGVGRVLLTHSATAALEMMCQLAGIGPGDEVILPSFTFATCASAVALRGATPVFADIDIRTLALAPEAVAAAITPRTRAIMPVHYAGIAADLAALGDIARRHGVPLLEDAAQCYGATLDGRPLGAIGQLGCYSFHDTKLVTGGEAGALVIGDGEFAVRAEIIRDKGTNQAAFRRGEIDRYSWVDLGSSHAPSEFAAAILLAQLEEADTIIAGRLALWDNYHLLLADAEARGVLTRPFVPAGNRHNGQGYYVLVADRSRRQRILEALRARGIGAAFHFVPLHSAPAGQLYGRAGPMAATDDAAARIVRLPLFSDMDPALQPMIVETLLGAL